MFGLETEDPNTDFFFPVVNRVGGFCSSRTAAWHHAQALGGPLPLRKSLYADFSVVSIKASSVVLASLILWLSSLP